MSQPPSDRAAEALRQLENLKRDYAVRTRAILEALAMQIGELRDLGALGEVESQLHKLAGSGGSFGYAELSRRARALELFVKELRRSRGDGFDPAALAQQVADLVQHLGIAANAASAPPLPASVSAPLRGILMLEPDPDEAERVAGTLTQFGHSVTTVERPEAVMAAMRKQVPEALLIDLDVSGEAEADAEGVLAVVQEVRDAYHDQLRDCALFFLTRHGSMNMRLAAARAEARGFFVKPVDPMHVVDRLDLLRQRRDAPRFRVLLVDDDQLLARHHASILEAGGFEVDAVYDPQLALDKLDAFRPDIVLLDMYMPGCSGAELARVIRMHDEWLALPIVFLSAETDMELQLTAASEGADDFLTKPIRDAHLIAAVRTRCERAHQMAALINRDSLTGLLKHARIKEELLSEVNRAQRHTQPLSVAMLDIDHFKRVNDSFGHPVGDQVIRALAQLLRQRVRLSDRAGRYGGEEFLLVLPNCDSSFATQLVGDLCRRFKALTFNANGQEFSVTLSAGIASTREGSSAADLIARADQALYAAKRNGRDRIELAD